MGKGQKTKKAGIVSPCLSVASCALHKLHAAGHAQRGAYCREDGNGQLDHVFPKFLVLHFNCLMFNV